MNLPSYVLKALDILNEHEAYIVGGCVRDMLLNRHPKDYDICTSALPNEILNLFSSYKTLDIGVKHGTVTVIIDDQALEITTFREEGSYKDRRRPDEVKFIKDINGDLKRRDFTINAMAYSPKVGTIDPFLGRKDLESKVIRSVGKAQERFYEDALRIVRAVRFSAELGFEIEKDTQKAIKLMHKDINYVSWERKREEFKRIVVAPFAYSCVKQNLEVMFEMLPDFKNMASCSQETVYHKYDVLEHSLRALKFCKSESLAVRLAILLHDVGKPQCKTIDEKSIAHFYGHAHVGAKIAKKELERLCFDRKTIEYVCKLIRHHRTKFPKSKNEMLRLFKRFGGGFTKDLLILMKCDLMAKSDVALSLNLEKSLTSDKILKEIENTKIIYKISDLEINGDDLVLLGIERGEKIGAILSSVLDLIIDEKIENNKIQILDFVKNNYR